MRKDLNQIDTLVTAAPEVAVQPERSVSGTCRQRLCRRVFLTAGTCYNFITLVLTTDSAR